MHLNHRLNLATRGLRRAGLALIVAGLTLASATATAQKAPSEKAELKVEVSKVKETPRPSLKEDRQGPVDQLVFEKKIESMKKIDEAIVRLKELLRATPKDNPQRAEFLFNLSEMYWEKSKGYEQKAFETQDECFRYEDAGDKQGAERCRASMKRELEESKRLRESSVELYVEIIRNYPDFEELDQVYYYLGANLMEVGKREQALDIFRRLIADYPKSEFVPNVLLAFGDYYFDTDDMQSALKAYRKVAQYPKSPVYPYAKYKEAWCYYNLDGKEKALDTFLDVVKVAGKSQSSSSGGLIKQTRKDIVLTYSHVGAPGKAIPFFKRISEGDEWLEMGERLAILYADKGKPLDSNQLYRELIRLNKDSARTIDYQTEIVRNTTTINSYGKESVEELIRLMKLVQLGEKGEFKDLKEEDFAGKKKRAEELVRSWSTTYHREAQKTKNPDIYAMAYFLYKFYLETFQETKKEYQMTFFYGELLYKLQKWEESAAAYERVLEIEPKGKYTNESVHALVLSYFKIVNISEEANKVDGDQFIEDDEEGKDGKGKEKEVAKVPEPKPIPELQQKLIGACEKYIELNPDGDRIVDVKYTMARTYYDFDHHDKAAAAFKDIAYSHPDHRLSVIAANLHLDGLNLLQRFDDLHAAVLEYLEKEPIKDEAFISDLQALNSNIRFKKCTVFDEKEQWKEAAQCFVDYFRDFPGSEHVDKALYNAALDYERMKELGKAIQVRIFLLRERPDSEYAPKTLYNIGGNYHALAVYSEAAKFYEIYAETYPKLEDAEVALSNAATFRHGLGQLDKAIENFNKYLENYGKRDKKKSAEVYYQIAQIYEQKGEKKKAYDQYNNYIRRFADDGPPDRLLESHVKIGMHHWNQKGDKERRKALRWFKKTLDRFEKFSKSTQKEMTTGRDAAAQAKFMLGEEVFAEMAEIDLNSRNEKELKKRLKKKQEKAMEAQKIFESVILFGRPDWAIAALYRIGSGYQNFANTIRNSKIPPRLTYDQAEIYRGILEDAAGPIEDKAVDAYVKALGIAKDQSWFNEYSKKSEIALAQLRPKEYRKPSELRAQPNHFDAGFTRVDFLHTVEDEDRLTDFESAGPPTAPPSGAPTSQR